MPIYNIQGMPWKAVSDRKSFTANFLTRKEIYLIIDSTTIGMESARTYQSGSREARFTCITDSAGEMQGFTEMVLGKDTAGSNGAAENFVLEGLEAEAERPRSASEMLRDIYDSLQVKNTPQMRRLMEENMLSKIQEETLKYLMRLIGGRLQCDDSGGCSAGLKDLSAGGGMSASDLLPVGGSYLTKGSYTVDYECETVTFSTKGTVNTADGRSLEFNVEAVMSRAYVAYSGFTVRESTALIDPLVINLDGSPATVSDQKYYFDIDADGIEDYVSLPSEGSGMLALDRNGDGKINDGSELFGPTSGDAFSELSEFDIDGNGWIDEADEVFAALKIFTVAEDGTRQLISLKDAGVGAICLQNAATEFSLKDAVTNATEAVIRKTGFFLFEDGTAGTAQQLDFAIA